MAARTVLVFDCESDGLPVRSSKGYYGPPDFNNVHLVQLAATLYDINTHAELETMCHLVRPVGFEIPECATQIHGITNARALEAGHDLRTVLLDHFAPLVVRADTIATFNGRPTGWKGDSKGGFDTSLIFKELRVLLANGAPLEAVHSLGGMLGNKKHVDVMALSYLGSEQRQTHLPYARPTNAQRRGPAIAYVKLGVLYQRWFGRGMDGAHQADKDVAATAECLWELDRRVAARGGPSVI
jgi:hypothetical protein